MTLPADVAPLESRTGWRRRAMLFVGVAAAYVLVGKLGLLLALPPGHAAPVFPAAGVALAALLVYGSTLWPAVGVGSALINLSAALERGDAFSPECVGLALAIGAGAALQAVLGAELVRRWVRDPGSLEEGTSILAFLGLGGPVSCLVSATIGTSTLAFFHVVVGATHFDLWWTWWVGDVLGVVLAAPLALLFIGEPRSLWQRRLVPVGLPLGVALAVVTLLFLQVRSLDRERIRQQFQEQAAMDAALLQASIDDYLQNLRSVVALYASSERVEREEFHGFVNGMLERHAPLLAVEWVPRVPRSEREAFVQRVRAEGYPGFRIRERDESGRWVRAGERDEYFPVAFVEPFESNEAAFGFDLGSEAIRHHALKTAAAEARIAATPALHLVQESDARDPAVLVFAPVFANGRPHDTRNQRHENLAGYVLGVMRIAGVVEEILAPSERRHMRIRIDDASEPDAKPPVYALGPADEAVLPDLAWQGELEIGGRSWEARFEPTLEYVSSLRARQPWGVLAGGLLCTGVLGSLLLGLTGQTARGARALKQRTAERDEARRSAGGAMERLRALDEARRRDSSERLRELLSQTEKHAEEIGVLGELADLLQSCQERAEAHAVIGRTMQRILPTSSGALYVRAENGEVFSKMSDWGSEVPARQAFRFNECVALRRSSVFGSRIDSGLRCPHLDDCASEETLCVPLLSLGEAFGVLHVRLAERPTPDAPAHGDLAHPGRAHQLVVTAAKHAGMALGNLRLQESLREQAIRDPLTGLFNRRYMEESLSRELSRAQRTKGPLSILLIDVDHFKHYNDEQGHAAGDAVLGTLGELLLSSVRTEDIACRYGGEEFALVLPGADLKAAEARAERVRANLRQLDVVLQGERLCPVTVSVGIAVFPDHGTRADALVRNADRALYEAKARGRDRVVLAEIR